MVAALITGGAVRLGQAMALHMAGRGADVVVHYASSEGPAAAVVAEARALGVNAVALQADLLPERHFIKHGHFPSNHLYLFAKKLP